MANKNTQLQGTDEWFNDRRGKFTSSSFSPFMKEPKGTDIFMKGAFTYLYEKIAERMTGETKNVFAESLDWGSGHEDDAKKIYEERTRKTITEVGFIPLPEFEDWAGGSPDGVIDEGKGIIEIKCPFDTKKHLETLIKKKIPRTGFNAYYTQIQMNMMATGATYCDFISYDGRIKEDKNKLAIVRYEKDEEYCKKIIERLKLAIEELKTMEASI